MNRPVQPPASAYFITDEKEQVGGPHARARGRQRAGRSRPRHRALFRPGLQHREPDRLRDRARQASLAHHRRHARRAACHRAAEEPARPDRAGPPRARPHRRRAPNGHDGPIERELAVVKVAGTGDHRVEALRLADAFRATIVDASVEHFIFEITGRVSEIDQFIAIMAPLGLVEVCRTGVAALTRGKSET